MDILGNLSVTCLGTIKLQEYPSYLPFARKTLFCPLQRLPRLEPEAGLFEGLAELYSTLGIPTTSNHYSLKTVLSLRSRRVLWKEFQEQVATARLGRKVHMNELVGQK